SAYAIKTVILVLLNNKINLMKSFKYLLFFICTLVFLPASAQEPAQNPGDNSPKGSLNSGTIEMQFQHLNSISNNYEDYKVVKRFNLEKVKSNVLDSLNGLKGQLESIHNQLAEQKSSLDESKTMLKTTQGELQQALDMKDSFFFMGMYIHKSTYNSLMWGIIIVLSILLLFFIYRFKKSYSVISEVKQSLNETREEFDLHRRNTLERERKLNRQLVDEMNKRNA